MGGGGYMSYEKPAIITFTNEELKTYMSAMASSCYKGHAAGDSYCYQGHSNTGKSCTTGHYYGS